MTMNPKTSRAVLRGVTTLAVVSIAVPLVLNALLFNAVPELSELYGTYVADLGKMQVTLELKPDYTFVQEAELKKTAKRASAAGKWTYTDSGSPARVVLDSNYMPVTDGFGEIRDDFEKYRFNGLSALSVRKVFGKLRISAFSEGGYYKKKNNDGGSLRKP